MSHEAYLDVALSYSNPPTCASSIYALRAVRGRRFEIHWGSGHYRRQMLLLREYLRINFILFTDAPFNTGPDIQYPLGRLGGWLACEDIDE